MRAIRDRTPQDPSEIGRADVDRRERLDRHAGRAVRPELWEHLAGHLFALAAAEGAALRSSEEVQLLVAIEGGARDEPHDLDIEAELFTGLPRRGVFRRLAGIDAASREEVVAPTVAHALDERDRTAIDQDHRGAGHVDRASCTTRCACARKRPQASQFAMPGAPSAAIRSSRSATPGSSATGTSR